VPPNHLSLFPYLVLPPPVQSPILIVRLKRTNCSRWVGNELELEFHQAQHFQHFPRHFSQFIPDVIRGFCTLPISSSWHPCTGARAPVSLLSGRCTGFRCSALRRRCAMNGRHKRSRTHRRERERERERPPRASCAHKGMPNFNVPPPPTVPCLCALSWPFFWL